MNEFERWPHVVLRRGDLRLTVLLPDLVRGYYRGPRFDWSGMVALAEWKGHTFFESWREPPHRPRANDDAAGTAEEFGMGPLTDNPPPVGYDDAAVGESFLKIGVGRLVKVRQPVYSFGALYCMERAAAWEINAGDDSVTFTQEERPLRGHAFRYTKTVAISEDCCGFEIRRTLKNTGATRIVQTHYCHNFLRIDDEPVGQSYSVELPFAVHLEQTAGDVLTARGRLLLFSRNPGPRDGFFGLVGGYGPIAGENEITIRGPAAEVTITGTLPLARLQFFGTGRTLCPEAFVRIEPGPAEEVEWGTEYRFRH
jgi:hypothetical protein